MYLLECVCVAVHLPISVLGMYVSIVEYVLFSVCVMVYVLVNVCVHVSCGVCTC